MKLVSNFISLAAAEIVSKIVTFAAFAYLARLFGPAGYGYIEWAGAALMCAGLIVDQGFNSYGAREIAKDPSRTAPLVAEIITARFAFAVVGYAVLFAVAMSFEDGNPLRQLLLIYGLSLFILPFLLQWVFQGHDRMHIVAITQTIRQVVFFGVIFLFVREPDDLLIVGYAEVAAVFAAAAFTIFSYRNFDLNNRKSFRPALSAKLFREGIPIGFSQIFWVVRSFGAILIIGLIATAAEAGYFAGAMRIFIALHAFVFLYFANLLPSFSRAWESGRLELNKITKNSLKVVLILGTVAGICWIIVAPYAITISFGQEFTAAAAALQWLGATCVAAAIGGHFRFGLIAAGEQTIEMVIAAVGAGAAVILLPLGYWNFGISGAGAALFFTEILMLVLAGYTAFSRLYDLQKNTGTQPFLKDLSKETRC
ncbi:MAG: oligosaccharide flippase family protein [Pyrinomonadaceae bacterium]|nr:oligosaccharide flippase family protein [Pyrinomonadaceae bacterium]